jgi:hypothetical protein
MNNQTFNTESTEHTEDQKAPGSQPLCVLCDLCVKPVFLFGGLSA